MTFRELLIVSHGEIAIHIARAATTMDLPSVVIYSEDDHDTLHPLHAGETMPLSGTNPRACLDGAAILATIRAIGAEAIHPDYRFLNENAAFARQCAQVGVQFIRPSPRMLDFFSDKARTWALAHEAGIPAVSDTQGTTMLGEARAFFAALPPSYDVIVKAVSDGGGCGMCAMHDAQVIADTYARYVSEAAAMGGGGGVYMEVLMPAPRHTEVQVVADAHGHATHLGERKCSPQRRHQKLTEIAPSPALDDALRARVAEAAVMLAKVAGYSDIGTFELLVEGAGTPHATFYFIEANPRVQVGHAVTEMVAGINLVMTQLALAQGASLADVGPAQPIAPYGCAVQVRINAETLDADGQPHPFAGIFTASEPPNDPGVRVGTCGYTGYRPNPRFDSLLAKLIVHAPHGMYAQVLMQTYRALCEFRIEEVVTNKRLLQDLLCDADVQTSVVHTQFLDAKPADLTVGNGEAHPALHTTSVTTPDLTPAASFIDELPDDAEMLTALVDGMLIQTHAQASATVARGEVLAVIEAMEMEHVITASAVGRVLQVCTQPGAAVREGQLLAALQPGDAQHGTAATSAEVGLDHIRPDLQAIIDRHVFGLDTNRPDAAARRRKTGQCTAHENVIHLYGLDSFIEYGALVIVVQHQRCALNDLTRSTPADGIITGIGTVNDTHFPDHDARYMVLAYDYTMLTDIQGTFNYKETDRSLELTQQWKLFAVLFARDDGGRSGGTRKRGVSGLSCPTFIHFARLLGLVPTVGIVSGRCFIGNAVLLGYADVIITTRGVTIGMGDPVMIESGGLGVYALEEIGPVNAQAPDGVIDMLVENETEVVDAARRYLSYFRGPPTGWETGDVRHLCHAILRNRTCSYGMYTVTDVLADTDSVLELRQASGVGTITTLTRIESRAFGCIANNPRRLGGAIDSAVADEVSRFMQLCNIFDLPIVSLCDAPGFMVEPEVGKAAMVRHVGRIFVTTGNLRMPFFTIVLHKGYGLGAMAMAADGFHAPLFTTPWPSDRLGDMDIESIIRPGYHKELEAVEDPTEREALFRKMVGATYEENRALNIASYLETDVVTDPADTRRWLLCGLQSAPPVPPKYTRDPATRRFIDTW